MVLNLCNLLVDVIIVLFIVVFGCFIVKYVGNICFFIVGIKKLCGFIFCLINLILIEVGILLVIFLFLNVCIIVINLVLCVKMFLDLGLINLLFWWYILYVLLRCRLFLIYKICFMVFIFVLMLVLSIYGCLVILFVLIVCW